MNWFVVAEHDLAISNAVSTHVLEICKSLSKNENVTLVSYSTSSNWLDNTNYHLQSIKYYDLFSESLSTIINTLRVLFHLLKQKQYIDILYVRASGLSIGPTIFAILTNTRCILEINGIWLDEQKLSRSILSPYKLLYVAPIHFIRHISLLFMARNASHIIVVTPQILEFLHKYGIKKEKIHVIHNGVNTEHFFPREIQDSKDKLQLNGNTEYFCYIGSIRPWQGLENLIAALGIVRNKIHYKLIIVGDGNGLSRLKDLVAKQGLDNWVLFTGSQPYHTIPVLITACRFMVSPKVELRSGYSSLKVYECLACGRPLIAPDTPGLSFISSKEIGFTYKSNDIQELSECILKMQNLTEDKWVKMCTSARKIAVSEYSWDIAAERIRNVAFTQS